jgi:predicted Rossmann fold nucleotide-binding protein DprA/Smf involved in DNA uptake
MPGGLDRPFPPENRELWHRFLTNDRVAFVSQKPFGRGTDSLTLRERSKLLVALSHGLLVAQSSRTEVPMNVFRAARAQRRPVATFEPDDRYDTSGNRKISDDHTPDDAVFPFSGESDRFRAWLQQIQPSA